MIQRILKKDMKRRKSINFILFLFITLASVFLSSSVNNILAVTTAVDYYLDYANVPDVNLIAIGTDEKEEIDTWLKEDAPRVEDYDYNTMVTLTEKGLSVERTGKKSSFTTNGVTMYLSTMDTEYSKVFNLEGEEFSLDSGEIALSKATVERNKLKVGDSITVKMGGLERIFTFKQEMKDASFSSDMVGMSRMMVCQEDYREFEENENAELIGMYYVNTSDEKAFIRELNNQEFLSLINSITRSTYALVYSFDMIMAALLILIGICLIFIAMLVLRFTLVFTIEEEYREIGIMKAVGMRDFAIKKLYLIKYFFLVITGALLGMAASIPVSREMVAGVSKNMIMKDVSANLWVNFICTLIIIVIVLAFCYGCTRKLNKVSAITAIRGGQSGERYSRRAGMRLHRRKQMPVPVFLGFNDMFSHVRRYLVLMITFCLSFILITIPLNTLNTMRSNEMADKFCMDPQSAVYVKKIEAEGETAYKNTADLEKGMERVTEELAEEGYEAELTGIPIFFLQYVEKSKNINSNIMTIQVIGANKDYLTYQEGEPPVLTNEIAFSKTILEENDWNIGDTVEMQMSSGTKNMIITGTYSDYMQLGRSARLSPELDCSEEAMFDYWNIMVDMETDQTQAELADTLSNALPDYEWSDAQAVIDANVGGIQQSLEDMLVPMTGMLCAVIMLITFLMERLFIVREKGEIAMMKSVGYKNRTIRLWQVLRMVWVALASMIAAIPISLLSNRFVLKPIFAIMGAEVEIQVVPWQVYGVFPCILLLGIVAATIAAALHVKKIDIRELNNLE